MRANLTRGMWASSEVHVEQHNSSVALVVIPLTSYSSPLVRGIFRPIWTVSWSDAVPTVLPTLVGYRRRSDRMPLVLLVLEIAKEPSHLYEVCVTQDPTVLRAAVSAEGQVTGLPPPIEESARRSSEACALWRLSCVSNFGVKLVLILHVSPPHSVSLNYHWQSRRWDLSEVVSGTVRPVVGLHQRLLTGVLSSVKSGLGFERAYAVASATCSCAPQPRLTVEDS